MNHFSVEQLQDCLNDDTDWTAGSEQLAHLDECQICQNRLAELSVLPAQLRECSAEVLALEHESDNGEHPWQSSENPAMASSLISVSIGPTGDWEEESQRRQIELNNIRTDFLEPAIHPELLGRLGRYDVEKLVGAGGFGIVFRAHDSELRRVVALKVLAPHLMPSAAARKRFAREAQTAAAIVHPHVIPIYDVISTPRACYLVMQYIAGQSLQDRVDCEGPLPFEDVLRIASQIAAGLDAAHQQGVVHRDVKPANILLEESVDRVMISDFGLARTADDANVTRSGVITGTPHYMSPEQASGATVDDRSDLFSLGSVMYFMITGRPPFRAPQIVAVLNRICHHQHRSVDQVDSQIPSEVSGLIDRLLHKDPERRFASAQDARSAIQKVLADWQSGKIKIVSRQDQEQAARTSSRKKRGRDALRFVGTTLAVMLAVYGTMTWIGPAMKRNFSGGQNATSQQQAEAAKRLASESLATPNRSKNDLGTPGEGRSFVIRSTQSDTSLDRNRQAVDVASALDGTGAAEILAEGDFRTTAETAKPDTPIRWGAESWESRPLDHEAEQWQREIQQIEMEIQTIQLEWLLGERWERPVTRDANASGDQR